MPHLSQADLGQRILEGGEISRAEALTLIQLTDSADIFDLMSWANRIRQHFRGNQIHLCSIVNAKAGGCTENCKFCAQSSFYQTESPRHGFLDWEPVEKAAQHARDHKAQALGIVAAWWGLKEGPVLDEVCERIEQLTKSGTVRADASLGIIPEQKIADRLKHAGLHAYNHNLETAEEFFPEVCTTHSYQDRVDTILRLKQAGIKVCSGGIFGMGETLEHRISMAFALKELNVDIVPMNFLNPIPGTPFEVKEPLTPMEILKTIAVYRFILPTKEIMVAGGREVNLRELQPLMFVAGASATMIGNYLTTPGADPKRDLQMIRDLGLTPEWDGCGGAVPSSLASETQSLQA
jgi:biotin synthase